MKTVGMIGGMSWESTALYYRLINRAVAARLGGLHSAKVLLYSVDFHDVEELMRLERWQEAGTYLAEIGRTLERGGADFLVLCTNTLHLVADAIARAVRIPLLHITDPTADAIIQAGLRSVGLLGTRFTMERTFYRERFEARGLRVCIPNEADREIVHRVIFDELCLGKVNDASRAEYLRIIETLRAAGADCIVFGCTEIGMLVSPADSPLPTFDTTELHAAAAAAMAAQ